MIAVSSSTIASGLASVVNAPASASRKSAPLASVQPSTADDTSAKPISQAAPKAVTASKLASQVLELQAKMDRLNPALAFVLDQASGSAVIQLTDRSTKEVIQQYPSAAAIQISKALDRFENGRLLNKTA